MGLDVSHDAWHGPYSMFMRWRTWLAKQIGIPLELMQGFYGWIWDDDDLKQDNISTKLWDLAGNGSYYDTLKAIKSYGGAIQWDVIKSPLVELLHHSDCDGKIHWWKCKDIALELLKVYRASEDNDEFGHGGMSINRGCYDSMRKATARFAIGALKAYKAREHLRFY